MNLVKLKNILQSLPSWISALSTLTICVFTYHGLYKTDLPEILISNLNQEVSSLKKEKNALIKKNQELISGYNFHLENDFTPAIRAEVIGSLQTAFDQKLDYLEKFIRLGYFYECLKEIQVIEAEIEKIKLKPILSSKFSKSSEIEEKVRKISHLMEKIEKIQDLIPSEWKMEIRLNCLTDLKDGVNASTAKCLKEILDNFRNSFSSDPKTGIDLVKGLKLSTLSWLPDQDQNTLRSFIVDYISQNSNIYKFPVIIKIMDYDSNEQIKQKAITAKKNLEAMVLDLPAFEIKLLEKINSLKYD
jgi:hypothetical protein